MCMNRDTEAIMTLPLRCHNEHSWPTTSLEFDFKPQVNTERKIGTVKVNCRNLLKGTTPAVQKDTPALEMKRSVWNI